MVASEHAHIITSHLLSRITRRDALSGRPRILTMGRVLSTSSIRHSEDLIAVNQLRCSKSRSNARTCAHLKQLQASPSERADETVESGPMTSSPFPETL